MAGCMGLHSACPAAWEWRAKSTVAHPFDPEPKGSDGSRPPWSVRDSVDARGNPWLEFDESRARYGYSPPMQFPAQDTAILQSILTELRADSGTLHAIGADGALHLRCAIGIPQPVLDIVGVVPVGKGMAGLAAQRGCPVNSCNIQHDTTGDVRPGARATGLAGSVAVPVLAADGRVLGVVGVATRAERTFTADDERAIASRGRAFFGC